jgi:hypothetical protein
MIGTDFKEIPVYGNRQIGCIEVPAAGLHAAKRQLVKEGCRVRMTCPVTVWGPNQRRIPGYAISFERV